MIAIVDYGMGNLRSVQKALNYAGAVTSIVTTKTNIFNADKLVLPGVGAMKPAMDKLNELGLVNPIKQFIASGKPFLGICLGYQLLFDYSTEGGKVPGLGIIRGNVQRFPENVKAPQMGWNQLSINENYPAMFKNIEAASYLYFCHSYFVQPEDTAIVSSTTDYGITYAASICAGNVWGVQFHPEKSQSIGIKLLENFISC